MGLDGKKWCREKLTDTRSDNQNYGNVAAQFLMRTEAMYSEPMEGENDFLDRFMVDIEITKRFVSYYVIADPIPECANDLHR